MAAEKIISVLYSGLYILLLGGLAALAVLSFGEEVPAEAREPPVLLPFRKMAIYIDRTFSGYRDRQRKKGKDVFIPGEEGVRTDLSVLYPSLKAKRQEVLYRIRRIEKILLLFTGGILLAGIMHLSALTGGILQEDGSVLRAPAGGGDQKLSLVASPVKNDPEGTAGSLPEKPARKASGTDMGSSSGGNGGDLQVNTPQEASGTDLESFSGGSSGDRQIVAAEGSGKGGAASSEASSEESSGYGKYSVIVHARQLTRPEAEKLAKEILKQFPDVLLGENRSASEIRFPLKMPSPETAEPFSLSWESSRYAVMDDDGSIYNSEYSREQAEEVELTAVLNYADYRFEKKMIFTVRAPVRDERELLREEIETTLKRAETESAVRESFQLPAEAAGLPISWREEPEDTSAGVLVLVVVSCLLAWYVMDYRLHEKTKERSRQLAIDYPQFTGRMVLYMGAGMSVRNVFYRCAAEYTEKQGGGMRYLSEEILLVCNEMDSGVSEAEAYMHFGRRCRSRQYTKLCSLLVQNLRRGNDELLAVLQEEARNSFEERKNLARELGEEAGTKLLFPMMIMLGITMLIIIVPAYFGFSM